MDAEAAAPYADVTTDANINVNANVDTALPPMLRLPTSSPLLPTPPLCGDIENNKIK